MKKFLSLVLSLTMMLSLVTVNSSAKEFTDNEDVTYQEAIAVISEIGVVNGYEDGSFKPQNGLTRGAAAKIICNLILGPTTASELHADARPFRDVAADSEFAGYIAYCAQQGIISGYADGTFRAGNPLTGYAFLKMLLGALGYDGANEGYTGANWSINVAKQAIGIGLNEGLTGEFNGVDHVTREEAALYAFNTLKSTMVDYDQKITTTINGVEVVISQGTAKPVDWSEGRNEDGNIKDDGFVQFAEEYFPGLVRNDDHDDFMRPANTWLYDKSEIGTYARTDLLVESYTTEVTGREAYDLLKAGVIASNKIESYLDGRESTIKESDLVRSNNKKLAGTGNGVVTEVYLDTDQDIITFVSVNTYLAKASSDYSESREYAALNVYVSDSTGRNYNVDVEQVPAVADVTADTFYQVNISYKNDNTNGEVLVLRNVEVLEDSTVTKFSAGNSGDGTDKVNKLTVGGEEYTANVKAFYDKNILNEYNATMLTDNTYNIIVDANGYFLGVELFEGTQNYVFITGYDLNGSNIATATADAAAIFLDGTMKTIQVDVDDTNANITKAKASTSDLSHQEEYFDVWNTGNASATLNEWYTYIEEDGVYTLKPAVRMTATQYAQGSDETIKTSNLSVKDDFSGNRVYGEDESVFVTVDLGDVTSHKAITEVDGVYTGIQSVEIEIDTADANIYSESMSQVYTVYDSDYYIVGAVVIGEATGSNQNLAFILTSATSEGRDADGTYYWEFDAILNGEIQTLTARSKYASTIGPLQKFSVMELRFDGEYVTNIKPVEDSNKYTDATVEINGQDVYQLENLSSANTTLNLQGRTFYITADRSDVGLAIASDAKAVTIQDENQEEGVKTAFSSVSSAIAHLADADAGKSGVQFDGDIYAVLNSDGVAQWMVFVNDNALSTGSQGGIQGPGYSSSVTVTGPNAFTVTYHDPDGTMTASEIREQVIREMEAYTGLRVRSYSYPGSGIMVFEDGSVFGAQATVTPQAQVALKLDGKVLSYVNTSGTVNATDVAKLLGNGTYLVGRGHNATADITVTGGSTSDTISVGTTDVEIRTAYTVTGLDKALEDGTTVNNGEFVATGTKVVVTGTDTSTNYRQFTVNGTKVGSPVQGESGVKSKMTHPVTANTTFAEVTGVMVKVDGMELGVYADSASVTFTGYDSGSLFASAKNAVASSDNKLFAAVESVSESVNGFTYTVDVSGDADNGVIELVQVAEISYSSGDFASSNPVHFLLSGGSTKVDVTSSNKYVAVGTLLVVTANDAQDGENIQFELNDSGSAADVPNGTEGATTGSVVATATYEVPKTAHKVKFTTA